MKTTKPLKKPNISFDDVIPDIKTELKGKVSLSIDIESSTYESILKEVYPEMNWEIIDYYFSLLCLNFDKVKHISVIRSSIGGDSNTEYELHAEVHTWDYIDTYRFYLTNPTHHVTPDQYICLRQLINENDSSSLAYFDELYQMILDNTEGLVLKELIDSLPTQSSST